MTDHTTTTQPRFGVWAPVYGTWGARTHPDDPVDSGYRRTRELIRLAEANGFTSTLLAQHVVNPSNPEVATLETWTASAAIAEATTRIEIIAAIKPLLMHPAVLAKLALGIDDISGGRFAINLVSAWFKTEMHELGIEMPPHDERYVLSEEWLADVRALFAGRPGRRPRAALPARRARPAPPARRVPAGRPSTSAASPSPPGALAARDADVFFINGRPLRRGRRADRRPAPPAARARAAAVRPRRVRDRPRPTRTRRRPSSSGCSR